MEEERPYPRIKSIADMALCNRAEGLPFGGEKEVALFGGRPVQYSPHNTPVEVAILEGGCDGGQDAPRDVRLRGNASW